MPTPENTPFYQDYLPDNSILSPNDAAEQILQSFKIKAKPEEILFYQNLFLSVPRVSVAVIGAGRAGVEAAEQLAAKGIYAVVFETESYPGGLASWGGGVSSILHDSTKEGAAKLALRSLCRPGVDFVPNTQMTADTARKMGFDAIVDASGGQENTIDNLNYDQPGVYTSGEFLKRVNVALDCGYSLVDVAKDIFQRTIIDKGIPHPVIIQGGGKVTEDAIVAVRTLQVILAISQGSGLKNIDPERLDPRKLIKGSGFWANISSLGLSQSELGEIIVYYRGALPLMKLIEPSEREIGKLMELGKLRDTAIDEIRKSDPHQKAIEREIQNLIQRYGVKFEPQHLITQIVPQPPGLIITAVGFHKKTGNADITIGMAANGRGRIADSTRNAKEGAAYLAEKLKEIPPDREKFIRLLETVRTQQSHVGYTRSPIIWALSHAPAKFVREHWLKR